MSEFLIDDLDVQVWYDLKSYQRNEDFTIGDDIMREISYPDQPVFYVRPHRENKPALIFPDECKMFVVHGKIHNDNGPAIVFFNSSVQWYVNGHMYFFTEWCEELDKSEEEINYLKLKWNIL